jgi:uncharacterized protein
MALYSFFEHYHSFLKNNVNCDKFQIPKMIDTNKINDIITRIALNCSPDKIILFGSYASGTPDNSSDLDLLIIKDTDLPQHRRSFDIYKSLIGMMVPIDILVYTNKEFEQEKDNQYSFISSAIKSSKIVYERK